MLQQTIPEANTMWPYQVIKFWLLRVTLRQINCYIHCYTLTPHTFFFKIQSPVYSANSDWCMLEGVIAIWLKKKKSLFSHNISSIYLLVITWMTSILWSALEILLKPYLWTSAISFTILEKYMYSLSLSPIYIWYKLSFFLYILGSIYSEIAQDISWINIK